jgi:hypothetical protein
MQFTMENDPTDWPGKNGGGLTSGRVKGKGTCYEVGSGPSGSGGDAANAGPNGTTKGPGGSHITGFHGSATVKGPKSWPQARSQSNPDKKS